MTCVIVVFPHWGQQERERERESDDLRLADFCFDIGMLFN